MQELEDGIRRMRQIVREQLTDSLGALSTRDTRGAEAVVERDDVVDSLNRYLEERCFLIFRGASGVLEERRIRSALRVVLNLERVGDAACHIAKHALMLAEEDAAYKLPLDLDDMVEIALTGLDESVDSFLTADLELAKTACHREIELDEIYVRRLHEVARLIDDGYGQGETVLHLLAVLKYLEKVCDFVLNIGETTVYAHMGTRLTYPQFQQLESVLPVADRDSPIERSFWDGISGATVLQLGSEGHHVVFKEGSGRKLQEEIDRSREWEQIAPAHTARVIAVSRAKGRTGILREFAEGSLLLDLMLSPEKADEKRSAMRLVSEVLTEVWKASIAPGAPLIDYSEQIRSRYRDLLRRHPWLEKIEVEELDDGRRLPAVLDFIAGREQSLAPPFSIWTHGDLNANNIVLDPSYNVIFIDVHRSRYGDYLQDVATLAVSSLRRFPTGSAAKGVRQANRVLYAAAKDFGESNGDRNFRVRLRLARARGLITSARLEDDTKRAAHLFEDGIKTLKQVTKGLRK